MGKKTIAEFVSDEPTEQLLERLGVDHTQGFYVGAPGPLSELAANGGGAAEP